MNRSRLPILVLIVAAACFVGCGGKKNGKGSGGGSGSPAAAPSFSLAWSEYPSWSVFGVAHEKGLVHQDKGKMGTIEKKWGVDIVLKQATYDTCLSLYGNGNVDAVCITNMDSLAPALSRDSVGILPTSTSDGADACIAVGIDNLDQLKGKTTYGLEKSVSQYTFERCLILNNKDPKDFPFINMDPGEAAKAMQIKDKKIQSIVVWNPFVLQTLRTRDGSKRLFDSRKIPEEIIDMVVASKDSLAKPGGEKFACAVIDTFYQVCRLMADSKEGDDTLVALGAKFSKLGLKDMKIVVKETQFYKTPEAALKLLGSKKFQKETMPMVVDFCVKHDMVKKKPKIGFDDTGSSFNFSSQYIKKVQDKK